MSMTTAAIVPLTEEQIELLTRTELQGDHEDDIQKFVQAVNRTGLDPFTRQIYPSRKRSKDGDRWVSHMSPTPTIDGLRIVAERTGDYAGQLGPFWCGEDGIWHDVWLDDANPPVAAKVGILRHNFKEPLWGVAKYSEYAQRKSDGKINAIWLKLATVMLAKCAEAIGLRRAFPMYLSGLYTREEMMQATPADDPEPIPGATSAHAPAPPLARATDPDDPMRHRPTQSKGLEGSRTGARRKQTAPAITTPEVDGHDENGEQGEDEIPGLPPPPRTAAPTLPKRMTPGFANKVKVHFGKNAGRPLSELSPSQREWYLTRMEANEKNPQGIKADDALLLQALRTIADAEAGIDQDAP
jgi:phage recombination protein Bet